MDIRAILKANGVDGELVDTLADTINAAIPKEFVSKVQYQKKVNAIDELNNNIADLEAKVSNTNTDEYKTKYDTLNTEFETFKTNIETEKTNTTKYSKLKELLKAEGVKDEFIPLLEKQFNIGELEIENNNIKGWTEIINPIKTSYEPLFTKTTTQGTPAATPPVNNGGTGKYTREQIQNMTHEQIIANYDSIKGSLADIK